VLIIIFSDNNEVHPTSFVTVKLYVPVARFDKVVLGAEPEIAPGLIVQFPEGNPVNSALPVAIVHSGCNIVPAVGAEGVTGCKFITISADGSEIHPAELVTE
jgi:hypothetical protein